MSIIVDFTEQDWTITVKAPSRMADVISRIPGLRVQGNEWVGTATPALMIAIAKDLSKIRGFEPTTNAVHYMMQVQDDRNTVEAAKLGNVPEYDDRLFDYQHAGVWMLMKGSALLGDEMGTGKTVMSLTAARQVQARAVLVVCPNSMKHRWALEEAAVWYPEAAGIVVHGTKAQKEKAIAQAMGCLDSGVPVVVSVNWESLRSLSRVAGYGSKKLSEADATPGPLNDIDWDVVIADEAHKAKDPNSKQTRALWAVSRGAHYRWALTGTPVLNTPGDLWAIGSWPLSRPTGGRRTSA